MESIDGSIHEETEEGAIIVHYASGNYPFDCSWPVSCCGVSVGRALLGPNSIEVR
jgi:hypothetical protein